MLTHLRNEFHDQKYLNQIRVIEIGNYSLTNALNCIPYVQNVRGGELQYIRKREKVFKDNPECTLHGQQFIIILLK